MRSGAASAAGILAKAGKGIAGAVDRAFAGDRHVFQTDKVEKRRGPVALDAFPARIDRREVPQHDRAFEDGILFDEQVHALLEEEGAAQERARRHDDDATAVGRAPVDDGLERLGVDGRAVADRAMIGDDVAFARRRRTGRRGGVEMIRQSERHEGGGGQKNPKKTGFHWRVLG